MSGRVLDEITPRSWQQWALYLLIAAVVVALSFAPAATCSVESSDTSTTTTVPS